MNSNKSSKLSEHVLNAIEQLSDEDQSWLSSIDENRQSAVTRVLGSSEFICRCCQTQPGLIQTFEQPLLLPSQYALTLKQQLYSVTNEAQLLRALRLFRHQHMAHIAYLDCLSLQSIETSLIQVSALADALITQAYYWLYDHLSERYGLPENKQPMCIIAMGKLGGHELNFSSDIDLIFAYPHKGETSGGRKPTEHQTFFIRLAQKLIYALDHVSTDGQVFRVDMRLRPFGDSGPLVMHFDAFEDYYHEQAREWERFAMVKARVLNPCDEYTEALENIIRPFVYKRYLDFTTLDALRDMKLKIFADSRRKLLTHNIKLGAGGIREAEFYVQTFQLIHGGQNLALREKNWQTVVENLVAQEIIPAETADKLRDAYLFLREVEHALQQMRNAQTQTLPDESNQSDWRVLVEYTCSDSLEQLHARLDNARNDIHQLFNDVLYDESEEDTHKDDNLNLFTAMWLSEAQAEEWLESLSAYGVDKPRTNFATTVTDALLTFKQKIKHAHLSSRAQQRIDALIPLFLQECITDKNCDEKAIVRVFSILTAILGRTTYLDLLFAYPNVRAQLIYFCGLSPWIATQLERFPLLLDELLSQAYLGDQGLSLDEYRANYQSDLRQTLLRVDPDDVEHHMDSLRQFKLCQQFRIAAADIHGSLPVERVSDKLTALAEVVLQQVIETAYRHMEQKYGPPDHSITPIENFAAVAYGKLGGYELGYGSDLDLVFIHNAPDNAQTTGQKSVSAQQFYIKMAQRIMHILNTNTMLGELYEADLRLRPAGNSGLLCCHVMGFSHYQNEEAWTWEHQALVRARVVFGGNDLHQQISQIRLDTLTRKRAQQDLVVEVTDMRKKLYEHSVNKTEKDSFKHGRGGITDIEFLSQYWVLAFSETHAELAVWPDNLRIIEAAQQAKLVSQADADMLKATYLMQRNALHHSALTERTIDEVEPELKNLREKTYSCWATILPSYIPSQ